MFGLDGVELGLIIVFLSLFSGILSGFPVAFAIGGAAIISFGIIAALDSAGLMMHRDVDIASQAYRDLIRSGVNPLNISVFRYPELPQISEVLYDGGWEKALNRNLSFIVNRMNERVLAGQSIETLLAVLMFVMMGITLERSKIADDLLTTMPRVFGPLPGGLAVSVVVVGGTGADEGDPAVHPRRLECDVLHGELADGVFGDPGDGVAGLEVRVLQHHRRWIDVGRRHAVLVQPRLERCAVDGPRPLGDQLVELGLAIAARAVGGVARITGELGPAHRLGETGEHGILVGGDQDPLAVLGARKGVG